MLGSPDNKAKHAKDVLASSSHLTDKHIQLAVVYRWEFCGMLFGKSLRRCANGLGDALKKIQQELSWKTLKPGLEKICSTCPDAYVAVHILEKKGDALLLWSRPIWFVETISIFGLIVC